MNNEPYYLCHNTNIVGLLVEHNHGGANIVLTIHELLCRNADTSQKRINYPRIDSVNRRLQSLAENFETGIYTKPKTSKDDLMVNIWFIVDKLFNDSFVSRRATFVRFHRIYEKTRTLA